MGSGLRHASIGHLPFPPLFKSKLPMGKLCDERSDVLLWSELVVGGCPWLRAAVESSTVLPCRRWPSVRGLPNVRSGMSRVGRCVYGHSRDGSAFVLKQEGIAARHCSG